MGFLTERVFICVSFEAFSTIDCEVLFVMRVCFISFEYPPNVEGGAGTYAEAIVNGLRNRGVDVFVITKGDQNNYEKKTFGVPTPNSSYWRRLFFMRTATQVLQRLSMFQKFDLVHFNEPHVILERFNFPTVSTLHSSQVNEINTSLADLNAFKTKKGIEDLLLKGPVGSISDIITAHSTNKIICPSTQLAKLIMSYCSVSEDRIAVVPNGVNLELWDTTENCDNNILEMYGLEEDNYILFLGRLSFSKGVQYLIEAFRNIKNKHPKLKLVIVGTGDFESSLRKITDGLKDVVFTGRIDSLAAKKTLYTNSLLVAVPSLYEAFPMVVLEAMACSKAVVASDVGDIHVLIKHGRNGYLSKPKDSKSLEKNIELLCNNEHLRKNMGSLSRNFVEEEFSTDRMVDNTIKVYQSLV
jgi:glycosyltransferase involved in cell wall biosynthesis